jgi:hypothetical protein
MILCALFGGVIATSGIVISLSIPSVLTSDDASVYKMVILVLTSYLAIWLPWRFVQLYGKKEMS